MPKHVTHFEKQKTRPSNVLVIGVPSVCLSTANVKTFLSTVRNSQPVRPHTANLIATTVNSGILITLGYKVSVSIFEKKKKKRTKAIPNPSTCQPTQVESSSPEQASDRLKKNK
jgi:hypothetical protein